MNLGQIELDKDEETDLELGREDEDDAAESLPSLDICEDLREPCVPHEPAISRGDSGTPGSSDNLGWHAGMDVGGYISRQEGPMVAEETLNKSHFVPCFNDSNLGSRHGRSVPSSGDEPISELMQVASKDLDGCMQWPPCNFNRRPPTCCEGGCSFDPSLWQDGEQYCATGEECWMDSSSASVARCRGPG